MTHADLAAIFRRLADDIEKMAARMPRSHRQRPPPEPPPKPVIDLGTVVGLQRALNSLRAPNFPRLNEDGVHGPVTTWALKELQATIGIPVTGEADEATVQAIHTATFGAAPHSHP